MRKPVPHVVRYKHSSTSKYVVEGWRENGNRKRVFFQTKAEAETWLALKLTQLTNEGTAGLSISDELRVLAAKCAKELEPFGKTIWDATQHYAQYLKSTARSCTFAELVDSFIDTKTKDGASIRHIQDLRSRFGRAKSYFGERKVSTIETPEIDDWLRALPLSPTSRNNFRTVLHSLFSYGVDRSYCAYNPVSRTAKAKVVDKPPEIFTPVQAHALLSAAATDIRPALAIGLFAGLRQAEIARIKWSDIDLKSRYIEVSAANSKTATRRLVKIEPNLAAWLNSYAEYTGDVLPKNARVKTDAAREAADKLLKEEKLGALEKWPENGLRHSYASYHLAHFKDASRLALELGHGTTAMLFAHYRELVRPEEAEKYWNIQPKSK